MRQQLSVVSDSTGIPAAHVPFPCMWDLVEFLSVQRIAVSYQYQASHFTVSFPRIDIPTARRILDDWSKIPSYENSIS